MKVKITLIATSLLTSVAFSNLVLADGEKLFQDNVNACWSCHGKDAKTPVLPIYPSLANQKKEYISAQMKDIKSGKRKNGHSVAMQSFMGLLDDKQIDEIAAWIASTAPAKTATAAPKAKEALTGGAKLFQEKTCWSCHGKDAKTPILPIYPNLTGLSKEYILNQMKDIKSGKRANGQSAAMKGVMGLVDDKQIEEIATWLATLK